MAQTKFKLNTKQTQKNDDITHAHTQKTSVRKPIKKEEEGGFLSKLTAPLSSSANLSVHLIKLFEIMSPAQKQQLIDYATQDDKTASCVIKEVLIEQGIIEDDV